MTDVEQLRGLINRLRRHQRLHKPDMDPLQGKGYVLYHLCHRGGTAQPGELSSELNITTPRMASILTALEKQGLVQRTMSPTDRRGIIVSLTDAGAALVRAHDAEEDARCRALAEALGPADTAACLRILQKILELAETP